MLVQSADSFDEAGDFDPATSRLATYAKTGADTSARPLRGHFGVLATQSRSCTAPSLTMVRLTCALASTTTWWRPRGSNGKGC
jgi:hypothetical protein